MRNDLSQCVLSCNPMSTTTVSQQISEKLYFAIVRIQADQELSWQAACNQVAILIDMNTKEFERLVANGARRRYNSEFMKQLNLTKKKLREEIRNSEDSFRVPCSGCHEPMFFSSSDIDWNESRKIVYKAFGNWRHKGCVEKQSPQ